jgi:hypothetical protein
MIFSQQWYDAIKIAKDRLIEAKEKQKYYYDRTAKRIDFKIGDRILLKQLAIVPGKFNMRWEGPYTVVEKKSNVSYRIGSNDGKKRMVVQADRMKKFQGPQATNAEAPGRVTKSKARVAPKQNVVQHRYNLGEKLKPQKYIVINK